jgi:5-methylcytosine-specific restriction enzyme subunit McrC
MSVMSVQVFEYGYVCANLDVNVPNGVTVISKRAYQYLSRLSLSEAAEAKSLRLKSIGSVKAIQFLNYVGVLVTPDGTYIEVLPKVTKHSLHENAVDDSRRALLKMLKSLGAFRHIQSNNADLKQQKMPLLEVFIGQFLSSVNELVKKGLKRDYQLQSDNLLFLKGKLRPSEQLKHNLVNKHRFAVEYDEYVTDTIPNRLVKTALQVVLKLTRSARHQRLARELEFVFADVGLVKIRATERVNVIINRGMEHYASPVAWSEIILRGMSPLSMQGDAQAFSLLFPLESVFESYVEYVLRTTLPDHLLVKGQLQSMHLVAYEQKQMFKLKPDIAIYKNDNIALLLDTKWKLIDASKGNGTDKFMLSQQDFYQMHAYGHQYLNGVGELVLIYPVNEKFKTPLPSAFHFSSTLRLWVVPFDIHHLTSDSSRLMLTPELIRILNTVQQMSREAG